VYFKHYLEIPGYYHKNSDSGAVFANENNMRTNNPHTIKIYVSMGM